MSMHDTHCHTVSSRHWVLVGFKCYYSLTCTVLMTVWCIPLCSIRSLRLTATQGACLGKSHRSSKCPARETTSMRCISVRKLCSWALQWTTSPSVECWQHSILQGAYPNHGGKRGGGGWNSAWRVPDNHRWGWHLWGPFFNRKRTHSPVEGNNNKVWRSEVCVQRLYSLTSGIKPLAKRILQSLVFSSFAVTQHLWGQADLAVYWRQLGIVLQEAWRWQWRSLMRELCRKRRSSSSRRRLSWSSSTTLMWLKLREWPLTVNLPHRAEKQWVPLYLSCLLFAWCSFLPSVLLTVSLWSFSSLIPDSLCSTTTCGVMMVVLFYLECFLWCIRIQYIPM